MPSTVPIGISSNATTAAINPGITNKTDPSRISVNTSSDVSAKIRQRLFSAVTAVLICTARNGAIVSCSTTGTVAACTKAGGMLAQFLAILALVPPLDIVSIIIFIPTVAALVLVALYGKETKGRDLRDLDPDGRTFAATGV